MEWNVIGAYFVKYFARAKKTWKIKSRLLYKYISVYSTIRNLFKNIYISCYRFLTFFFEIWNYVWHLAYYIKSIDNFLKGFRMSELSIEIRSISRHLMELSSKRLKWLEKCGTWKVKGLSICLLLIWLQKKKKKKKDERKTIASKCKSSKA